MNGSIKPSSGSRFLLVALCGFLAVAGFLLWTEHRAHVLGALPYLLLLLCPVFHLLMHGRHRHDGHQASSPGHAGHLSSGDRR